MLTDLLSLTEIAFIVVLVIPALIGLTNMAKRLGLPVDFAGPLAVVLGIVVMLSYVGFGENRYFIMALVGLLVGLGVTGYYDLSKQFGTPSIPPAIVNVDQSFLPPEVEPGVLANDEPLLQYGAITAPKIQGDTITSPMPTRDNDGRTTP